MEAYSRKISSEEARENYILVYKDKLAFFPSLGRQFDLTHGTMHKRAKVESYQCTCRGPESRHEHYFIRWDGLKQGDMVFIKKDAKKAARYVLQLQSTVAQEQFCG
ncbi:MAG TPA: hypothetical protein VI704_06415 [Bacteroidota bacterium]|nr:hypothetical protein [Bacteroidota bacterium]